MFAPHPKLSPKVHLRHSPKKRLEEKSNSQGVSIDAAHALLDFLNHSAHFSSDEIVLNIKIQNHHKKFPASSENKKTFCEKKSGASTFLNLSRKDAKAYLVRKNLPPLSPPLSATSSKWFWITWGLGLFFAFLVPTLSVCMIFQNHPKEKAHSAHYVRKEFL